MEMTLLQDRHRSLSGQEDDNRSQTEEQDPSGGTFQSGKWYGISASGSVAPASVLEQLQNAVMPTSNLKDRDTLGQNFRDSKVRSGAGSSSDPIVNGFKLDSSVDSFESVAADNMKSLVQECGVSPHKFSELLQELPPSRVSDVLIDYYFNSINWTRYPVSECDFRAAYASIRHNGRDGVESTSPSNIRFLPLLFVILAIAVRLAPEQIVGDARTRRVTSLRYYWSSRRSLLIAAAVQPDSLDIVLTRLLSARFLTFDRRITECWSQLGAAVRTAQALGLHRDGSTMRMAPGQVEYRRRIWSYLYHADRSYAMALGRPNSIQDDYTSTKPPSNIEDESSELSRREPYPLSHPTLMTFVILRHQLASIIGRIVHHFQQVRERSHYSDVVALDDELLKFTTNLPPHFSLEPDISLDDTSTYIPVHRFLLITEILFIRIGLHRPYLLRRLNSDRYARSRTACFESAVKDFDVRQAFREQMPNEVRNSLGNAYREFQTAMISGIYLVLEPRGSHAKEMHAILDAFMEDHEGLPEMDETTHRELKTIGFLKSKASQAEALGQAASTGPTDHAVSNKPEQQPRLLPGPQHSSSPPSSSPWKSFPSILNPTSTDSSSKSPTVPGAGPLNQSPTFQRLQYSSQTDYVHSPATSGSPHADDESPAQSLLDHWFNTVSNAPIDPSSVDMSWCGPGAEFTGWVGPSTLGNSDPRLLTGSDGSDWTYWETLVNQIQRGP